MKRAKRSSRPQRVATKAVHSIAYPGNLSSLLRRKAYTRAIITRIAVNVSRVATSMVSFFLYNKDISSRRSKPRQTTRDTMAGVTVLPCLAFASNIRATIAAVNVIDSKMSSILHLLSIEEFHDDVLAHSPSCRLKLRCNLSHHFMFLRKLVYFF